MNETRRNWKMVVFNAIKGLIQKEAAIEYNM